MLVMLLLLTPSLEAVAAAVPVTLHEQLALY
jgi:hypothetical protein